MKADERGVDMKRLLIIGASMVLASANATPITGPVGVSAKAALTALGGKVSVCKDSDLSGAAFRATCGTLPLGAGAFKVKWAATGAGKFAGLKLARDWKLDTDPAYPGAFSRAYVLDGQPLLVYYQPTGATGHLSLVYGTPVQAAPATTTKFRSCAAALAAGYSNMRRGTAGYSPNLDRDNDGIACDK
ncbi:excalibur calcium-binding domain-containing protein [Deinococcus frigens]|uniref:excalibur calcium-binding domain-containing protein n=1 Tax=Deinococcus frigens TaxID=249403 RepID=UPI00055618CF|nr:excalibur calcium-binding domain-containing protein [Deinococcus frigens]